MEQTPPIGKFGNFNLFSDDDSDDDEDEDGDEEAGDSSGSHNGGGSEIHDTNAPGSQENFPSQIKGGFPLQPKNSMQNFGVRGKSRRSAYQRNN
jgi:hypothetical protein